MTPKTIIRRGSMTSANSTALAPRSPRALNLDTRPPLSHRQRLPLQPLGTGYERNAPSVSVLYNWSRPSWPSCPPRGSGLGRFHVALGQLLDVHVLEGEHLDVLREPPGGAVHVPHPRVGEGHLEEHVAGLRAGLHVDLVAQVEAPVGLDDVLEDAD